MSTWNRDKSLATVLGASLLACLYFMFQQAQIAPRPGPGPGPGPAPDNGPVVVTKSAQYIVALRNLDKVNATESAVLDCPMARALKLAGRMVVRPYDDDEVIQLGYTRMLAASGDTTIFAIDELGNPVGAPHLPSTYEAFEAYVNSVLKEVPEVKREFLRSERVCEPGPPHDFKKAEDGTESIEVDGHVRKLNARSSPAKLQAMRKFADFNPIIPKSQYRDIDRSDFYKGEQWIPDQDGIGECVGCGWAGAARRVRLFEGGNDTKLSPAYIYAHINGGEDRGAVISEGIDVLLKKGTCAYSTLGIEPFYTHQLPPGSKEEALRFRAADVYRCDSVEELESAIQANFMVVFGAMVGDNFGRWDKYGVAGHDRGPGNHCMMIQGMKKLPTGRYVYHVPNSWGYGWGPFKNGTIYLDQEHLFSNGVMPDICVIRSMRRDPVSDVRLPALRGK